MQRVSTDCDAITDEEYVTHRYYRASTAELSAFSKVWQQAGHYRYWCLTSLDIAQMINDSGTD